MFQIQALNKRPIQNNQRTLIFWLGLTAGIPFVIYLFFVLSASGWNILTAIITVLQNDLLLLIAIGAYFGVVYYILSMPSKKVDVVASDETITIDNNSFEATNLIAWSVVELDDCFELVIKFQESRTPYQYIYITKESHDLQKALSYFSNNFPYDEQINTTDRMHNFFRLIGVK